MRTIKTLIQNHYRGTTRFVFFLASWLFLWLGYGDVLYQVQLQSFWVNMPIELYPNGISYTLVTYVAYFLISLFTIPCLGALVISLILVLIEVIFHITYKSICKYYTLSYIPSIFLLFVITSYNYDIFLTNKNHTLIVIVMAILAYSIIRTFVLLFWKGGTIEGTSKDRVISSSVLLILYISALIYSYRDPSFRTLTKMRYYEDHKNWERVINIAEKTKKTTRPIAAYHAIGLSKTGEIGERIFNISHQYTPIKFGIKDRTERTIYDPDITYHSGLIRTSYHHAMEQMVIGGVNKYYLKLLTKCSVICRDSSLAEKFMTIIERMPFEGNFVKHYRNLNRNPELIKSDYDISAIMELAPETDAFEQEFPNPVFLTYLARRNSGSEKLFDLSVAASLYLKDFDSFSLKLERLSKKKNIPKYFQEAIIFLGLNQSPEFLKRYRITMENFDRVRKYWEKYAKFGEVSSTVQAEAKKEYGNSYMYYVQFENEENKN